MRPPVGHYPSGRSSSSFESGRVPSSCSCTRPRRPAREFVQAPGHLRPFEQVDTRLHKQLHVARAARPPHLGTRLGATTPTPSPALAMRTLLHPGVLVMQLAGLLIWAWSIVDVVPAWHWGLWIALDCATTAFVAGRETSRRS